MGPIATGLGEVFHYRLSSTTRSLTDLRTIQEWVLRPALRTVPGPAEINSWGGYEKENQVRVHPLWLVRHRVTFTQVLQAGRDDHLNVRRGSRRRAGLA